MTYKSRSITSKASSAVKINMGLVDGARDLGESNEFTDHSANVESRFGGAKRDVPDDKAYKDEEGKEKDTTKKKGVGVDSTVTPTV
jgi:hypothetical protein